MRNNQENYQVLPNDHIYSEIVIIFNIIFIHFYNVYCKIVN